MSQLKLPAMKDGQASADSPMTFGLLKKDSDIISSEEVGKRFSEIHPIKSPQASGELILHSSSSASKKILDGSRHPLMLRPYSCTEIDQHNNQSRGSNHTSSPKHEQTSVGSLSPSRLLNPINLAAPNTNISLGNSGTESPTFALDNFEVLEVANCDKIELDFTN